MNSRQKFEWADNKCGLGIRRDKQLNSLEKMLDLVKNMSFGKVKRSLIKKPFQTGIIVSIKSTLELFKDLSNEGFEYLLTSRLNQDSLENIFSQLRAMGGNCSHPNTVQTMRRIKHCV